MAVHDETLEVFCFLPTDDDHCLLDVNDDEPESLDFQALLILQVDLSGKILFLAKFWRMEIKWNYADTSGSLFLVIVTSGAN